MPTLKRRVTDLLVTHGERVAGVDPCHTPKGLEQIKSLIPAIGAFSLLQAVAVGTATRFEEMFRHLNRNLLVLWSDWLGTVNCSFSTQKMGRLIQVHSGESRVGKLISPNYYVGICQEDLKIVNAWNLVRIRFHPGTIFLCGQPFIQMLVTQSKTPHTRVCSAGLYGLNRQEETIRLLVKGTAPEDQTAKFQMQLEAGIRILQAQTSMT